MSSVRGGFFQRNLRFFEGQIGCKCVGYKDLWKNPRAPIRNSLYRKGLEWWRCSEANRGPSIVALSGFDTSLNRSPPNKNGMVV